MTTVLHTADTHLGYSQYHSETRAADFAAAFQTVIDEAVDRDVDAVVHSGDLFHQSRPGVGTLSTTLNQLQRLDEAEIPFLGIVGNHEGTSDEQWVDVFGQLKLGIRLNASPTVIGDTAFYGLDYVSPARRPGLDYEFEAHDAECSVLVAHGLFAPVADGGRWELAEVMDASSVKFDGYLLGDDHMPHVQTLRESTVTYPGSTDRTASDQRSPRGFNIVTTGSAATGTPSTAADGGATVPVGIADDELPEDGDGDGDGDGTGTGDDPGRWPASIASAREVGVERATEGPHGEPPVLVERCEMQTRPFRYVSVAMDEGDGMGRVRAEIDGADLTGAVAIVHLTGDGDPLMAAPIEEYATEAGAMIASVTDRRAFSTDGDATDVSFADPEAAVDRRVQDMGLSAAGHDIENMVRSGEVSTTSMADTVEEDIGERIEESEDDLLPVETETGTDAGEKGDDGGTGEDDPNADVDRDGADDPDGDDGSTDAEGGGGNDDEDGSVESGSEDDETAEAEGGDGGDGDEDTDADADGDGDGDSDSDTGTGADTDQSTTDDGDPPDAESDTDTEHDDADDDDDGDGQMTLDERWG